ncbi:MAG: phosphoenolpyruvate synthase, partial [Proteobacteria bacterium]|nr:phosphoenolpyruvate synthase [Pseudomonadota bacterium]
MAPETSFVRGFESLRLEDVDRVGGKNAALGELFHTVCHEGIRVPRGFAVTVTVFEEFLKENHLLPVIEDLFSGLPSGFRDPVKASATGLRIRTAILSGRFDEKSRNAIVGAYHELTKMREGRTDVAVRSSATTEDLPEASFAGQQETFLNVKGDRPVLDAVRACFASLYTDRAIVYRAERNIPQSTARISVGIQEMVRSDLAVSGVMFTLEPETGFRNLMVINSSYGLGESVVGGTVNPDEYWVYKPLLGEETVPIVRREIGSKEKKRIYHPDEDQRTIEAVVPPDDRLRPSLTDSEVLELAGAGVRIEQAFSQKRNHPTPMDIEWAKDGLSGLLYIVQARPETVQSRKSPLTA